MQEPEPRPLAWMRQYTRLYPRLWDRVEALRADHPATPPWCYLPITAGIAISGNGLPGQDLLALPAQERITITADACAIAALSAWRRSKGIYRFDPALVAALRETPPSQDLPPEVLQRLPEWCVYIDTPAEPLQIPGAGEILLHGYFAHLEWDALHRHAELRLLLDTESALIPIAIDLTGTIASGVADALADASVSEPDLSTRIARGLAGLVARILYLCAESPDIQGPGQPGIPPPIRAGKRVRAQSAQTVRTWDVGVRIGAALRHAQTQHGGNDPTKTHASPRAHVRRAHWHHYWTGPRTGRQQIILRWVHPVLVAAEGSPESLPAVIRPVQSDPT